MTDCRICQGPVEVDDGDTAVIQGEGLQGYVCGFCMRDTEPSVPTRVWFDVDGREYSLPPRAKA